MLGHSILKTSTLGSELASQSQIKPQMGKHKRNIAADLLLTALIDAFSILVIFLLMSFSSTGEILFIGKDMELPKSAKSDVLDRHTLVKIENGQFFIEDKQVAVDQLVAALLAERQAWQEQHPGQEFVGAMTVQADRRLKYEVLNNIVLASSHAGYSDLKFAVLMK